MRCGSWTVVCCFVAIAGFPALALGQGQGDLYGDLYILERDGNGEPILDAMGCEQPVAEDCAYVPLMWWRDGVAVDEDEPCDVDLETAEALGLMPREVAFGRLSVARSPQHVRDQSYGEVVASMDGALAFGLDVAGRLELQIQDPVTLELSWKTIDSPLENLAIYQELLLKGHLSGLAEPTHARLQEAGLGYLVPSGDPDERPDASDLLRAASVLAGAGDKEGFTSLDAMINVNTYLDINVDDGNGLDYFDFGDFTYDRKEIYPLTLKEILLVAVRNCPSRYYECFGSKEVSIGAQVDFRDAQVCRGGVDVTGDDLSYGSAQWVAQAIEDSRATIWFVHNWGVPEE